MLAKVTHFKHLSLHQGPLHLTELVTSDAKHLEALSNRHALHLDALKYLTEKEAKALTAHESISLNGLKRLDAGVAYVLSGIKGGVSLLG